MDSDNKLDLKFIRRCLSLAKRGSGKVSPNPLVGAVLVKNGEIIGEGWHEKYGAPHAEVNAIINAKKNLTNATLYCNLEPCCHSKKQTPPCVPIIIDKKIKRVVISNIDPNMEVNGKGVAKLRKAGIDVSQGIMEHEGKEINKFYFKSTRSKIPFVTVKIAQSADGKISKTKGKQTWLTGKESIIFVHKLRGEFDAVLVGANTIKIDDPLLTVRDTKGRNPVRIIIDGKLSVPLKSKVLECDDLNRTWIFTSVYSGIRKSKILSGKGVEVFRINSRRNYKLDLKQVLEKITEKKITSVLVEGGAEIFLQMIDEHLFDEIIILKAPKVLGKGVDAPHIENVKNLRLLSSKKLGKDIRLIYGKNLSN